MHNHDKKENYGKILIEGSLLERLVTENIVSKDIYIKVSNLVCNSFNKDKENAISDENTLESESVVPTAPESVAPSTQENEVEGPNNTFNDLINDVVNGDEQKEPKLPNNSSIPVPQAPLPGVEIPSVSLDALNQNHPSPAEAKENITENNIPETDINNLSSPIKNTSPIVGIPNFGGINRPTIKDIED